MLAYQFGGKQETDDRVSQIVSAESGDKEEQDETSAAVQKKEKVDCEWTEKRDWWPKAWMSLVVRLDVDMEG